MQDRSDRMERQNKFGLDPGLLVAAGFILLEMLFAYPPAGVEPDSVRVGRGIINGIESGEGLGVRDLYGRAFSFGYYALFFALYPRFFADYGALPAVMNAVNLVATAGALVAIHRWTRLLWGGAVALAIVILMALTPVLFELGGYAHPEGPAFLALNLAILALLHAVRPGARKPLLGLVAATAAAFSGAALRADILLGFPFLLLLAPLAAGPGRGRRAFGLGLLVVIVATGAFFVTQEAVARMTPARIAPIPTRGTSVQPGMGALLLEYWRHSTSVKGLAKGTAVWATGLGPVLLLLGFAGLFGLGALWRRSQKGTGPHAERHRSLASFVPAALAAIVPGAIFWLPNPIPSRHLLLTFLGLVPAAVLWLRTRVPERRFPIVMALVLAANLVAMNAIVPIVVKNYRFTFTSLLPRRGNLWVPMGDPITARLWARRQVRLELAEAEQMATTAEPKLLVFGGHTAIRLTYELYARGDYAVDYEWRHGAFLYKVKTPKTEYVIYDYSGPPDIAPAEFMRRIVEAGDYRDFAVALVPTDVPIEGAAAVPPGYRAFTFDLAALLPGWTAETGN
jgi:hypothetical protein